MSAEHYAWAIGEIDEEAEGDTVGCVRRGDEVVRAGLPNCIIIHHVRETNTLGG